MIITSYIPALTDGGLRYFLLKTIPAGRTETYSEAAQYLGDAKAHRAVATACAHNKIAVLIPCHRVISKNSKNTGYRWGVEYKKKLLAREEKRG